MSTRSDWLFLGAANRAAGKSLKKPAAGRDRRQGFPSPWDTCRQRSPESVRTPFSAACRYPPARFRESIGLGLRLHALGQFVQDIDGLVHPAPLLLGLGVDLAQSRPEAPSHHRQQPAWGTWSTLGPEGPVASAFQASVDSRKPSSIARKCLRPWASQPISTSTQRRIRLAGVDVDPVGPEIDHLHGPRSRRSQKAS